MVGKMVVMGRKSVFRELCIIEKCIIYVMFMMIWNMVCEVFFFFFLFA